MFSFCSTSFSISRASMSFLSSLMEQALLSRELDSRRCSSRHCYISSRSFPIRCNSLLSRLHSAYIAVFSLPLASLSCCLAFSSSSCLSSRTLTSAFSFSSCTTSSLDFFRSDLSLAASAYTCSSCSTLLVISSQCAAVASSSSRYSSCCDSSLARWEILGISSWQQATFCSRSKMYSQSLSLDCRTSAVFASISPILRLNPSPSRASRPFSSANRANCPRRSSFSWRRWAGAARTSSESTGHCIRSSLPRKTSSSYRSCWQSCWCMNTLSCTRSDCSRCSWNHFAHTSCCKPSCYSLTRPANSTMSARTRRSKSFVSASLIFRIIAFAVCLLKRTSPLREFFEQTSGVTDSGRPDGS